MKPALVKKHTLKTAQQLVRWAWDIPFQVIKPAELIPGLLWQPWSWVGVWVVQTNATSQEKTPLIILYLVLVLEQINAKNEREQKLCVCGGGGMREGEGVWGKMSMGLEVMIMYMYLVFLKKWAADITVERVGEMVPQHAKSGIQVVWLLSIVNGVHKQIHKPVVAMEIWAIYDRWQYLLWLTM